MTTTFKTEDLGYHSGAVLRVRTDFSGAALGDHVARDGNIEARLREEALVRVHGFCYDYSRHFAFGVENLAAEPATVEVAINARAGGPAFAHDVLIYAAESPSGEFKVAHVDATTDGSKAYRLTLSLGPGSRLYLANHFFRQYEKLSDTFDTLADRGGGRREVFGRSLDGRDLVGYRYSARPGVDPARAVVLITSGLHPAESDTVATEAIMEALTGGDRSRLLGPADLFLVPLANPDGFVRGYNGCNAAEVNFFWQFDEQNERECPEAHFLWRLIGKLRPVVYVDFHGYTFQPGQKMASPYLKPTVFYAGRRVRRLARRMNADVLALSHGHATRGVLTYSPSMLAAKITRRYNTITYAKYHLRLRDGIERNRDLAVSLLRRITERLAREGVTDPALVLKRPAGCVSDEAWRRLAAAAVEWWGVHARKVLGKARRWGWRCEPSR